MSDIKKLNAEYKGKRRRRWRLRRIAAMLGCVVVFVTALALMMPAISMTHTELTCGTEEHAHSDACYQQVLTCTKAEDADHQHTDACYETELTCGLDEHQHSDSCYTTVEEPDEPEAAEIEEPEADDGIEVVGTLNESVPATDTPDDEASADGESDDESDDEDEYADDESDDEDDPDADEGTDANDSQTSGTSADKSGKAADKDTDDNKEEMPAQNFKGTLTTDNGTLLTVSVEAPQGAFPLGTTMKIKNVQNYTVEAKVENAVSSHTDGKVNDMQAVDITFLDKSGAEIEPAKKITVKFTSDLIVQNDEALVVHVDDYGNADVVKPLTDQELQQRDKKAEENELFIDSDKFSVYVVVYTVDLTFEVDGEVYETSIVGGSSASFRELVQILGVVADDPNTNVDEVEAFMEQVANVEFTDPDLLAVCPIDAPTTAGALKEAYELEPVYSAGLTDEQIAALDAVEFAPIDWALISLEPFTTEEALVITMVDGQIFDIYVTDEQITTRVLTADGQAYKITVTYDEDAQIPAEAELYVTEILAGTDEYESYLAQSAEALGHDSETIPFARFFDIEIRDADGYKVEPAAPVQVSIAYDDAIEVTDGQKLSIVHFADEGEEVRGESAQAAPEIITAVALSDDATTVTYEQASFSITGTIVEPGPSGVNDLDGYSVTIYNNGQYLGNETVDGNPNGISKTSNSSKAATWTFEATGTDGQYYIYTMVNDEPQYMHITSYNGDQGNAFLSSEPQALTVSTGSNGAYRISRTDNNRTYYLNHWGGGTDNRFCAYAYDGSPDAQLTFDFTPPVIQDNGKYAVIVEYNGKYYAVENDGSLVEVEYSVENNVAYVEMDYPIFWTYVQDGGFYNLRIPTQAATFEYNNLPRAYYYRYIDPNAASGITEEESVAESLGYPEGYAPRPDEAGYQQIAAATTTQHEQYRSDCAIYPFENNVLHGRDNNYLGIDPTTMTIKGGVSASEAVTVYFAEVTNVNPSANLNHTVNHIDISIEGGATLSVPLAYGTYYYEGDDGQLHELVVGEDNNVTLELTKEKVDITPEDMKHAEVTAFSTATGKVLNNAFYITGYSQNHDTSISTPQVRLEGSFKVADLDPYDWPEGATSQSDAENRLSNQQLQDRLDAKIVYTVTAKKEVTFDWTYEYAEGKFGQLYDADGNPLSSTVNVNLSKSFDYWDPDNECPPIKELDYGTNVAKWEAGHIIYGTDQGDGSGMDFKLEAHAGAEAGVVAIEITKTLLTDSGDVLHPNQEVTNQFVVYQKIPATTDDINGAQFYGMGEGSPVFNPGNTYSGVHAKTVTVGTSGEGLVYDYDVKEGMVYIQEDADSIKQEITDVDNHKWTYVSTETRTAFTWREHPAVTPQDHVVDGTMSTPEVIGNYGTWTDDEGQEQPLFNGFQEFYVYNVYAPKPYNLTIKKVDATNLNQVLEGAQFDLYGPYDSIRTDDSAAEGGRQETKANTTSITTDENGLVTIEGLRDGVYYLYETDAPSGYSKLSSPVCITVDSSLEPNVISAYICSDPVNVLTVATDPDNEDTFAITITNSTGVTLPATGGMGTMPYTVCGLTLMAIAVTAIVVRRRGGERR